MSISVKCPDCLKIYKLKPEVAGKQFKCKVCGSPVKVPKRAPAPPVDDDDDFLDAFPTSRTQARTTKQVPPQRGRDEPKASKASAAKKPNTVVMIFFSVLGLMVVSGFVLIIMGVMQSPSAPENQQAGLNAGQAEEEPVAEAEEKPAEPEEPEEVPEPEPVIDEKLIAILEGGTFTEKHEAYPTQLTKKGPSPQKFKNEEPPLGVEEVTYTSGELELKAWIDRRGAESDKSPCLVYFHEGFAFTMDSLEICAPFREAGYIIVYPMFRGENGNPGNFELFFGEVRDARAACQWAAKQPDVDTEQLYALGHTEGGAIALLLSLMDDVPLVSSASIGGLYEESLYDQLGTGCPFNYSNVHERDLRSVYNYIRKIQRKHYVFVGRNDPSYNTPIASAQRATLTIKPPRLMIRRPVGDHVAIVPAAVKSYMKFIEDENSF